MCRAIRNMSQGKGVDPSQHLLVVFGGAAGQHCCQISDALQINKIFVHTHSGVLSAYGLSLAEVVHDTSTSLPDYTCTPHHNTLLHNLHHKVQSAKQTNIQHLA